MMTACGPGARRPRTLFEKIWDEHVVADLGGGAFLLHVDRHLVHEVTSYRGFEGLRRRGIRVRNPELTFAVVDHIVATAPERGDDTNPAGLPFIRMLRRNCDEFGVTRFDIDDRRQGIVHVIGPELGLALPGTTLVCGDSHTSSNGAVGALAWGIGASEVEHVLATQTIVQRRPKTMRLWLEGAPGPGVFAKDLILHVIGRLGTAAGRGHAVEYAGPAVARLSVEERLTICNMSIELGARAGLVAPDDRTFEYLAGREFAPRGRAWDEAVRAWRGLRSDGDAVFDAEAVIDCGAVEPQVTWGTSPQDVLPVGGRIPDPAAEPDPVRRRSLEQALAYMALVPGAAVARGRRVAPGVRALVVPGSTAVRRAAEQAGLDRVFREAGFEWRAAGCSMCVAGNGDVVPAGKRCISSSNRNFEGRQGPGSRTHLASPASVAAAAVTGAIVDVRRLG